VGLELRLAWRNVWRNARRTGLTVAATVFAVVLVVFFVAMAAGIHEKMIEDSVRVASGHVTLAGEGYFEGRTLEQYVTLDAGLAGTLDGAPGVRGWAPRLVGFALVSKDTDAQGVAVLGVDPARETSVTTLARRVKQGAFVSEDVPKGIVLGERLARNLGAELGDELLLYSEAYSLETAYDLFTLVGVMKLPEPSLDRSLALLTLTDAQAFFVYGERVSEVALLADDADAADRVAAGLRDALPSAEAVEVQTWAELMPELVQFIILDDAGMYVMLMILVVVVAFGILNTILMSVLERTRELGVLLALGLRPGAVFRLVYLESLLLAGLGLAIGLALSIPLVLWFQGHPVELSNELAGAMELIGAEPVVTWKLKPWNPAGSVLTILGVAALAALYPAIKASRGRPVDALRSV
jgi:ABC-type lipoprotein release transport system permease subunit